MKVLPLRLRPDQDLRLSLEASVKAHQIQAGFILTAVGSLTQATLRLADQSDDICVQQKFEIVSLGGTLSIYGIHLHLAVADSRGQTLGGHLQAGCLIYTTAEIVLGISETHVFYRPIDPETGFRELDVQTR
ncbi:MAG: DNA-binding protein [Oscillatoriales cyanobacterium RM2_1_1]|nr:DNA-binding protein [Oscillatoriales cyanobacterium SM2_3_0]NJO45038.1 DNA-binding protein [Oscillatoriales cyanobacterium RM2_1_1]